MLTPATLAAIAASYQLAAPLAVSPALDAILCRIADLPGWDGPADVLGELVELTARDARALLRRPPSGIEGRIHCSRVRVDLAVDWTGATLVYRLQSDATASAGAVAQPVATVEPFAVEPEPAPAPASPRGLVWRVRVGDTIRDGEGEAELRAAAAEAGHRLTRTAPAMPAVGGYRPSIDPAAPPKRTPYPANGFPVDDVPFTDGKTASTLARYGGRNRALAACMKLDRDGYISPSDLYSLTVNGGPNHGRLAVTDPMPLATARAVIDALDAVAGVDGLTLSHLASADALCGGRRIGDVLRAVAAAVANGKRKTSEIVAAALAVAPSAPATIAAKPRQRRGASPRKVAA